MTEEVDKSASSQGQYLKDVFLCSLVAFGGPEAHLGVFYERLVAKKNYLSEKALMEWMALCSFLPGPTSTQVITGIGLERGGRSLALLTLLIWATPAILLMTALSFIPSVLSENGTIPVWLDFLAPMAAGFVAWAAWKLGRKVATDWLTILLWVVGATTPIFFHSAWAIPLAFLFGGLFGQLKGDSETDKTEPLIRLRPPWIILVLFIGFALLGIGGSLSSGSSLIEVFERFYRYGYLVFGGGQVVVPLMQGELVHSANLMTQQEFLSGFGVVQAMPGPMFSFAAYAGGLCEQAGSATRQSCRCPTGRMCHFSARHTSALFCSSLLGKAPTSQVGFPLPHWNQCRCRWAGKRGIRTDRTQPGMEQVSHLLYRPDPNLFG